MAVWVSSQTSGFEESMGFMLHTITPRGGNTMGRISLHPRRSGSRVHIDEIKLGTSTPKPTIRDERALYVNIS